MNEVKEVNKIKLTLDHLYDIAISVDYDTFEDVILEKYTGKLATEKNIEDVIIKILIEKR